MGASEMTERHAASDLWAPEGALFGVVLRRRRKDKGWTQVDLANALGVAPSVVSRWETGETPMTLTSLLDVSGYLDVPASHLLRMFEKLHTKITGKGVQIGEHSAGAVRLTTRQLEEMK